MHYNSVHLHVHNSTPFLPGISHLLHGRRPRPQRDQIRLQIKRLQRQSLSRLCEVFGAWLPMDLFKSAPNGTNSRERVFSTSLTFWAYLSQILDSGCACREVVRKVQVWHARRLQPMPRSGTGAYCQARKRLPLETLLSAHRKLADRLMAPAADSGNWRGHRIRVVDGTGVSMPDTPQNRKGYSQPSQQKPGCGFPVMGLVGVFCLQTGALLRWVQGQLEEHECRLFMTLIEFFEPGDIVLADRGFSGYGQLAALKNRKVDSLMRLHQARKEDCRKGKRPGKRDRLVTWKRPYRTKTSLFSKEAWEALPETLTVRLVQITVNIPGFRTHKYTVVTTLLDPERYPAAELGRLYFRRWTVEVFYRDIKQTMAMDILRCKSPEMIDKELAMHAIAYNLIRALMADIAATYQVAIERISFKGTLDALRQWQPLFENGPRGARVSRKRIEQFYQTVADDPLILRRERSEPRAVKRRPKNYRLLTKPRPKMVVEPSRKQSQKPSKPCLI
jgi:hypothetical protein